MDGKLRQTRSARAQNKSWLYADFTESWENNAISSIFSSRFESARRVMQNPRHLSMKSRCRRTVRREIFNLVQANDRSIRRTSPRPPFLSQDSNHQIFGLSWNSRVTIVYAGLFKRRALEQNLKRCRKEQSINIIVTHTQVRKNRWELL